MRQIAKLVGICTAGCVAVLLVSAGSTGLLSFSLETTSNDDGADIPVWETGTYWTYDIDIAYEASGASADVTLQNTRFEVVGVDSETYSLDVAGAITGSVGFAGIIEGQIQNTEMSGTATVNKTSLALEQLSDVHIEGDIQRTFTTTSFRADLEMKQNVTPVVSPYDFPVAVDETWTVPLSTFWLYLDAEIDLAVPYGILYDFPLYVEEHVLTCTGVEDITVPAGTYQAYHVTDDGYEYWYAPSAGNVVETAYRDIRFWYNESLYWDIYRLDARLLETNFQPSSDPPYPPSNPAPADGASNVSVDTMLQWEGGDPDDDTVTYDVYLGTSPDPSLIAAGHPNTTYQPGRLQYNTTYRWRIVARDQYGYETNGSLWTFTTAMSTNTPPDTPSRPSGPTTGRTGTSYTYTSSTTDDTGPVYYRFDWGDGTDSGWLGPYDPGAVAAADYTWSSDGNYSIRVRAKDGEDAESDWSDPLVVSMPLASGHIKQSETLSPAQQMDIHIS